MYRTLVVLILGLTMPAEAAAGPDDRTAKAIDALLRGPLRSGETSLLVVDATTGERLFEVDADAPMNPASNVKLIATAAALDLLGPDYRYRTRVLGPAPDDHGVIGEDLYLLGSYDPTLTFEHVDELAAQL